ncbi:MAG: choice-of-anchor M domain-containing protein [Verrucomicrobiota bacterium]
MMKKIWIAVTMVICGVTAQTSQAQLWTAGHGDLGVGFEGGNLEPHWHLGEDNESVTLNGVPQTLGLEGQEFEASEITAQTGFSAARPVGVEWDFLGTTAGQTTYFIPELEQAGVPFLGFGSEELNAADWATPISLTLTSFTGPGVFSLYQNSSNVFMTTSDGVSGADVLNQNAGGHAHYTWAFSALGTYQITLQASGTTVASPVTGGIAGNTTYTSGAETFTVNVVPEPTTFTLLLAGLAGMVLTRRRR